MSELQRQSLCSLFRPTVPRRLLRKSNNLEDWLVDPWTCFCSCILTCNSMQIVGL